MKRKEPMLVGEHMTKSPLTVATDAPLLDAREILREHGIRHLPALEGEKLVGILSDRNLKQALALSGGERFLWIKGFS